MLQGNLEFTVPLPAHRRPNPRRDAIKASGGAEYEALLARERSARAAYRARHPDKLRSYWKREAKSRPGWHKQRLVMAARKRGRQAGLEASIRVVDLVWPTHCPVLGIELDYPKPGQRRTQSAQPNWPSLDRWDNTKGYVPGNVFVISYRANTLKNSSTYEEILRVAKYLSRRPSP